MNKRQMYRNGNTMAMMLDHMSTTKPEVSIGER